MTTKFSFTIGGIKAKIYRRGHEPAHFQVWEAGRTAKIDIETLKVMKGGISHRGMKNIIKWAGDNQSLLMTTWKERQK